MANSSPPPSRQTIPILRCTANYLRDAEFSAQMSLNGEINAATISLGGSNVGIGFATAS
jgi:hypothetical protein